jgi:hypothetical protein
MHHIFAALSCVDSFTDVDISYRIRIDFAVSSAGLRKKGHGTWCRVWKYVRLGNYGVQQTLFSECNNIHPVVMLLCVRRVSELNLSETELNFKLYNR